MTHKIEIFCKNLGKTIEVSGGETLLEIAGRLGIMPDGMRPIVALVNNKTEPLGYAVYGPKQVEFLSRSSAPGTRAYTRSLCMMLYCAVRKHLPDTRLRIEHSISGGYYCRLIPQPADENITSTLLESMRRLHELALPFCQRETLSTELIDKFRSEGMDDKVLLLETIQNLYSSYSTLDGVADSYYGALAPSTAEIDTFDLKPWKEGYLLMGVDRKEPKKPAVFAPQDKMYEAYIDHLHFNDVIGVSDVGQLNREIELNHSSNLIQVAEAMHSRKIGKIADEIAGRYHQGGARIVLIAGPSSSGKTTTTKRLAIYLTTNLLKPKMISLDNYFVNRDLTPRDADGDFDFESIYALDLKAFNADLSALLRGEEVALPTYNFERGERVYKGDKMRLDDNSLLLIEGIHGLNPMLTAQIEEKMKYRVYVSALTTLSIDDHNWIPTTDNRLLRRIIRDYKYRGTSAVETIRRWPSVRRGEEKWIFPYQENADSTFNSSLLFELAVMKDYAEAILRDVPNNLPEYAEAYRLRRFLSYFKAIGEKGIPSTSLLREFLGGSSFHY